jgi:hypothetical protein
MDRKKVFQTVIVILVGVSIPGYIIWKNIFPSFDYSTSEETFYGFEVFKRTPGNKNLLVLPELDDYFFNEIKIELKLKKPLEKRASLDVYKGYQALYFEEGASIKSKEEFLDLTNLDLSDIPNGGLFSYNDSVNVLSGNYYFPIFSADLLNKMGYEWSSVKEKGGDFAGNFQKGERIIFGEAHPDGTIFEVNQDYYLIWKEKKRKLDFPEAGQILKQKTYSIIEVDSKNRKPLGECLFESPQKSIQCKISKNEFVDGFDYVFDLKGVEVEEIEEAVIGLEANPSGDSFRKNTSVFYSKVKRDIAEKYREYLF